MKEVKHDERYVSGVGTTGFFSLIIIYIKGMIIDGLLVYLKVLFQQHWLCNVPSRLVCEWCIWKDVGEIDVAYLRYYLNICLEWHMKIMKNLGQVSKFVGQVSDSRFSKIQSRCHQFVWLFNEGVHGKAQNDF